MESFHKIKRFFAESTPAFYALLVSAGILLGGLFLWAGLTVSGVSSDTPPGNSVTSSGGPSDYADTPDSVVSPEDAPEGQRPSSDHTSDKHPRIQRRAPETHGQSTSPSSVLPELSFEPPTYRSQIEEIRNMREEMPEVPDSAKDHRGAPTGDPEASINRVRSTYLQLLSGPGAKHNTHLATQLASEPYWNQTVQKTLVDQLQIKNHSQHTAAAHILTHRNRLSLTDNELSTLHECGESVCLQDWLRLAHLSGPSAKVVEAAREHLIHQHSRVRNSAYNLLVDALETNKLQEEVEGHLQEVQDPKIKEALKEYREQLIQNIQNRDVESR